MKPYTSPSHEEPETARIAAVSWSVRAVDRRQVGLISRLNLFRALIVEPRCFVS